MKLIENLGYFLDRISLEELLKYFTDKGYMDRSKMFFCVEPESKHDENPRFVLRTSEI